MNVSAIIVTRGDVPMQRIIDSFPEEWEVLVWVNGDGLFLRHGMDSKRLAEVGDLAVYGRYAAIEYASHDLIYVQDDDCVVSDPQALVDAWEAHTTHRGEIVWPPLVANMPQPFRHDFYSDHCLVGFGAVFHRDAPERAWWRFRGGFDETAPWVDFNMDWFHRTCDIVFTALTPRVLVDVPYENLPWAEGPDRMYRQREHVAERTRMLELVRKVRDGTV